MAKYYKVIVETVYYTERIVKAESEDDVSNSEEKILKSMDLLADVPEVNVSITERPDMDDDDVEIDLTNTLDK